MPCMITHKLFAEEVLKQLKKADIKELIQKHSHLFYIGSSGPDILFYHHALPWQAHLGKHVSRLGNAMHSRDINAFYQKALEVIGKQKHAEIKERMMAYLLGHLCHWALDKHVHPYIFHRTGNHQPKAMDYHHRFESDLDYQMLGLYRNVEPKDYHAYEMCTFDDEMLQAIARLYVPIAKEVYHVELKVHEIREALESWYQLQKLFQDPSGQKFKYVYQLESLLKQEWKYSGYLLRNQASEYDVLNQNHLEWCHPCDDTKTSTASFPELFEEAIAPAINVLQKCYGCMEYNSDASNLLEVLKNQSYDTGMGQLTEMKYFNIIYE